MPNEFNIPIAGTKHVIRLMIDIDERGKPLNGKILVGIIPPPKDEQLRDTSLISLVDLIEAGLKEERLQVVQDLHLGGSKTRKFAFAVIEAEEDAMNDPQWRISEEKWNNNLILRTAKTITEKNLGDLREMLGVQNAHVEQDSAQDPRQHTSKITPSTERRGSPKNEGPDLQASLRRGIERAFRDALSITTLPPELSELAGNLKKTYPTRPPIAGIGDEKHENLGTDKDPLYVWLMADAQQAIVRKAIPEKLDQDTQQPIPPSAGLVEYLNRTILGELDEAYRSYEKAIAAAQR